MKEKWRNPILRLTITLHTSKKTLLFDLLRNNYSMVAHTEGKKKTYLPLLEVFSFHLESIYVSPFKLTAASRALF